MKSGRNITLVFPLLFFCFYSCTKAKKELSPEQIQVKADSILRSAMPKLKRQAKEDLDNRLPIELKPKIDSILKVSHDIPPLPKLEGSDSMATKNTQQLKTAVPDSVKSADGK